MVGCEILALGYPLEMQWSRWLGGGRLRLQVFYTMSAAAVSRNATVIMAQRELLFVCSDLPIVFFFQTFRM